jgi:non-heme chloroperoxidase
VVFSQGWPLSADAWDNRRSSTQPCTGNDMDTYADDLAEVIEALYLHDVCSSGTPPAAAR